MTKPKPILLMLILTAFFGSQNELLAQQPVSISIDGNKKTGPMSTFWAYFGYDEPNYTYMKDGRKLLTEIAELSPVPVYVRTHNLLTSGDGKAALKWGSTNAYTEDAKGNPVYNWTVVDSIFDTYVNRGMKPIAEIGFMPEALSTHPTPYRHYWKPGDPYEDVYTGWAYPPKDYNKWGELVYQWVKHSVQRYGEKEVKTWWWEVWNEPNIGYWKGTPEEYLMLYDYAADAVKRALPGARIGGPTSTGPGWDKAAVYLENFLKHCAEGRNYATGKTGSPLDYISFHAKGSPKTVNGHVQMNMRSQLKDADEGFRIVAESKFKNLPIIIGECDPEGCAACGMSTNPENAYRNGTLYSSYTAASFPRIIELARKRGVKLEGAVSWSFEFENQPWFFGFRDLATNGVDKPVLNVFRMYGMMKGSELAINNPSAIGADSLMKNGVRNEQSDVHASAANDGKTTTVMLWNYHDDDVERPASTVNITLKNIGQKQLRLQTYIIDQNHSNSYTAWKKMGSPKNPTPAQIALLEKSGQLQEGEKPRILPAKSSTIQTSIRIPAQGVMLLKFSRTT